MFNEFRQTQLLYRVCSLLIKAQQDNDEVFNQIVALLCQELRVTGSSIWIATHQGGIGQQRLAFFQAGEKLSYSLPNLDYQAAALVFEQGNGLVLHNIHNDENFHEAKRNDLWVTAYPLKNKSELIGVFCIWDNCNKRTHQERENFVSLVQKVGSELTNGLYNYKQYSQANHKRIVKELETARRIQFDLMPKELPVLQGISLGVRTIPANEVGGDYLDIFLTNSKHLGIAIGDVMGKGIPAALWMAMTKVAMRTAAKDDTQPHIAVSQVNSVLFPDLSRQGIFVTLLYALYDPYNKTLLFSNAGHLPPLLFRSKTQKVEPLQLKGAYIGGVENKIYQISGVRLQKGDIVLFYTDGLIEALNSAQKQLGVEKVAELLNSNALYDASQIIDRLIVDLGQFTGDYHQTDDITLAVLKVEE
ncbi:Serine phosphatase RsbU, regulator of sigma subunit [Desulfosporosinus sp. I2]|uniref:GAF domain-containing SpoIIE family protein phosphatase n=1 Tax=Desulfosporosinus sp. I2 TaxID=1617025 RepID=UPI00061FB490|nr:GAF domain-containing SpoIIE family protein phosphatase [Desulfosporosinus sp. I2]KJR46686.1 Serine phosphatase RsbU, regulator of sigma subunit [Desulfosporosinus sp. I2]